MRTALPNSEMFNVKYFNSGPQKYFYLWALEFSWFIWYLCLVAQSCLTLCDPMAHQATLSMEFSGQEYCSELPCSPPEIFPTQGLNPGPPHCRQSLYHLSHQRSHLIFNPINLFKWLDKTHIIPPTFARLQKTYFKQLQLVIIVHHLPFYKSYLNYKYRILVELMAQW